MNNKKIITDISIPFARMIQSICNTTKYHCFILFYYYARDKRLKLLWFILKKKIYIKTIFNIPTYKRASMLNLGGIRGRKTNISLCFIRSINYNLSKNICFSRAIVNRFWTVFPISRRKRNLSTDLNRLQDGRMRQYTTTVFNNVLVFSILPTNVTFNNIEIFSF